jgi:Putative transposase/Transposase zinc-binding domain
VVELADIFARFADAYQAAHGPAMPASHRRAIADIIACRTQALGGHLWRCDQCGAEVFAYHSCKNRSCPKCHTEQTQAWLDRRRAEMLPAPYFHVTITVPEALRPALRSNQRDGYSLLIKASAEAIIELARDHRFVGGTVGVMTVLHTWTQQLLYHPHVHCLVTGGGVSADHRSWCPARKGFLFPTKALAKLVRGKLKAMLHRRRPDLVLPRSAWRRPWVVHITAWGEGEQAVLDYLARYVFRVAITNTRITGLDDHTVTIRYKQRKSSHWRTCQIAGGEFIRRFLQHVLPKGFHKIRYFGLWHARNRDLAARVRLLLLLDRPAPPETAAESPPAPNPNDHEPLINPRSAEPPICPHCQLGHLVLIGRLTPRNPMGP